MNELNSGEVVLFMIQYFLIPMTLLDNQLDSNIFYIRFVIFKCKYCSFCPCKWGNRNTQYQLCEFFQPFSWIFNSLPNDLDLHPEVTNTIKKSYVDHTVYERCIIIYILLITKT